MFIAFRYAICLDRILVLKPIFQQQSFSRWRFPGCRGNALECYFAPIHGCQEMITVSVVPLLL